MFVFALLIWKGFDGLLINFHSDKIYEADIRKIETSGTQGNRFLKIRNGIALGSFIYSHENSGSAIEVIYPIISADQLTKAKEGKPAEAKVLVKITGMSAECLEDGMCFLPDSTVLTGLTESELLYLGAEQKQQLQTEGVKVSPNAVLLLPNTQPITLQWNLLMLLGGSIFAFAILKSFFRKASSLEDYWEKVTEKKMD